MAGEQKLNIEIAGNSVKLDRTLKNVNAALVASKTEARALSKELSFAPGNQELLVKRQTALKQALELSSEKAKMLKENLKGMDANVDPKGFLNLQKQILSSERDGRSLSRQLTIIEQTTARLSGKSATFKFNPGTGAVEFQNSLKGVEAALNSIGGKKNILNFKPSTSGVDELQSQLVKTKQASGLLSDKLAKLKSVVKDIDPKVNPDSFNKFQSEINETQNDLKRLDNQKVDIKATLDSKGLNVNTNSIGGKLRNGLSSAIHSATSGIKGLASSGMAAVGHAMTSAIMAPLSGIKNLVGKAFSGVGNVMKSAITAPLSGLKNVISSAFGSIVQGGLLTIGNKLTTGLGSLFSGVTSSMQDTSVAAKSFEQNLLFTGLDTNTINKAKKEIQDFAVQSTFASSDLDKVTTSLATSGVKAKGLTKETKNIAAAYALLGDGSRNVSEIGTIFSQINSAGKLLSQDFNQLKDAGIGGAIKTDITKAMPGIIKQYGSFNKAMEEGAISADMVNDSINRLGSSKQAQQAALVPKTMGAAFDNLQEGISQKFQGMFEKINSSGINTIGKIADWINNIDVGPLTAKFDELFKKVHGIFDGIDIDKIKTAFTGVFGFITQLMSKIDFSAIFASVIPALENVGGVIKSFFESDAFQNIASSVQNLFVGVFNIISGVFRNLQASIQNTGLADYFTDFTEQLQGMSEQFKDFSNGVVGSQIADFFSITLMTAIMLVKSAIDTISQTWTGFMEGLDIDSFTDTFSSGFTAIRETIRPVLTLLEGIGLIIGKTLGEALALVLPIFHDVFDAISPIIQPVIDIVNSLLDTIKPLIDMVVSFLHNALEPIKESMEALEELGIFDSITSTFSDLAKYVQKAVKFLKPFTDFLGKIVGWAVSGVLDLVVLAFAGLGEAIKLIFGALDKIFSVIGNVAGSVLDWLGNLFGFSDNSFNPGSTGESYSTGAVTGDTYSTSTSNVANITVNAAQGQSVTALAKAIKHEFILGTA